MRNLELERLMIHHLPLQSKNINRIINVLLDNATHYFVLANNFVHHVLQEEQTKINKNDVKTIELLSLENVIFMGNGSLFECYNTQSKETNEIYIEDEYEVHMWNPTQDKLALITKNGILKVILLNVQNNTYTVTGQHNLNDEDQSLFVNVGWGSKQTQFRGSEGKILKSEPLTESALLKDDGCPEIVWREDGEFFMVGVLENNTRIFKVFSQDCEFLFKNEAKPGLCKNLAWKPDASIIATEQQLDNYHNIVFFEKNGLYRYEFQLKNNIPVKRLQWNPTGDILMIWHSDKENNEISLWTCKNYHWYLKQNLIFPSNNLVLDVNWDKKCLEVVTENNILHYNWRWVVHTSNDDLGIISVIDGRNLRFTVTAKQIVPPPLYSYKYEFNKPVNFISFAKDKPIIAVVLDDGTFNTLEYNEKCLEPKYSFDITQSDSLAPLDINHLVFDHNKNTLFGVKSLLELSTLCKFDIGDNMKCTNLQFSSENITSLDLFDESNLIVHANELLLLNKEDSDKIEIFDDLPTGQICLKYLFDQYHTFCLSNNIFYYNNKKIMNITSFIFCENFLLLTTNDNRLLCVKLSQRGLLKLSSNHLDMYNRSIPCGALLVKAISTNRKVILQVPRGDFETISPRVLSIEQINQHIHNGNYLEAYKIMRVDRLNLNIFFDINPQHFLEHVADFVKAINSCEYLDVFLTQLTNTNVANELYANCFEDPLPEQLPNKLHTIADSLINCMKSLDVNRYLQSIITAYVCKNTDEDLENALKELRAARTQEKKLRVENILEHMIILSSVEKLFEIALGMYDFETLTWIASKSQLDPMEYLPFLRELNNMEENYCNYKINAHIKRYEKAFQYLIKCDKVLDELQELVEKHNLHKHILKYVQPDNQWYKQLLLLYSNYLDKMEYYNESGIVLRKIGLLIPALNKFMQTCNVNESLCTISQIDCDATALNEMYSQLVTKLLQNNMHKDASCIYEEYLKNYEEAIVALINGKLWTDAIRLATKYKRKDIIEVNIKPELYKYLKDVTDSVSNMKENLMKYTARLQIVRTQKVAEMRCSENIDPDNNFGERTCEFDLESVVSTNYSTTSRSSRSSHGTSASSRRRKRIEKKVLQLREGSAFEGIALMRHLHLLISEIQNYSSSINEICNVLLTFDDFTAASQIYHLFNETSIIVNSSLDKIWPAELLNPTDPTSVEFQMYRQNLEHLDMQYRCPPPLMKINFKIFALE